MTATKSEAASSARKFKGTEKELAVRMQFPPHPSWGEIEMWGTH